MIPIRKVKRLSPYKKLLRKWENCTACPLSENRTKFVLLRGKIPADVLFVGEGPGQSEDVDGYPFAGPAGRLLNRLILEVANELFDLDIDYSAPADPRTQLKPLDSYIRLAFTNLVCCIPKKNDGVTEPNAKEILACSDRLRETLELAKPRLIVWTGTLSAKKGPKLTENVFDGAMIEIHHPAAILRTDEPMKSVMYDRCRVRLLDAFEELAE